MGKVFTLIADKAGRIEHVDEYYLNDFIAKLVSHPDAALKLMRQTPRCPNFLQDTDWPICCGELTEYTGEPSRDEAEELDRSGQYWYRGKSTFDSPVVDLIPSPVLSGVSAFRCQSCAKRYWIFQFA